ncbi:HET-domain-containing protein [Colletotrichum asianum]
MDITRKLGVRYLWIDSLCIVQDDADDWDREAARMAQVYSQAYVTIAATPAADGTHGLIRKARDEPLIPLHFQSSDSLNRGVSIGPSLNKFQRIDREPLDSRAWTLQEQVLSPRTLHFAADQVHWECRQSIISESGSSPYGYGQGESAENSIARGWLGKMARDIVPDIKPGNEEVSKSVRGDPKLAIDNSNVSYENWYRMLQNYTERNITKDVDRLPALSGIARAFSSKSPSLYLAGIWLDDIASGLLWYVNVPESARCPDTYRAPSWSWAAIEGSPVTFLSTHFFGRRPGEVDEIEYVDHNIDLDSADPFGRVKAGSLTLRG